METCSARGKSTNCSVLRVSQKLWYLHSPVDRGLFPSSCLIASRHRRYSTYPLAFWGWGSWVQGIWKSEDLLRQDCSGGHSWQRAAGGGGSLTCSRNHHHWLSTKEGVPDSVPSAFHAKPSSDPNSYLLGYPDFPDEDTGEVKKLA